MIRVDHILTMFGAGMAGIGVGGLVLALTGAEEQSPTSARIDTALAATGSTSTELRSWPPIFGEAAIESPSEKAAEAPDPLPDYTLKGLVAASERGWAIVTGPEADHLVGPGSTLPGGVEVVAIRPSGVEVVRADRRFLIEFAGDGSAQAPDVTRPNVPTADSRTLSLSALRDTGLRKALGLAGGSKVIDRGNGALAQEIVWVRNGRLYDRIGLRKGDTVLTINGIPAGDMDALGEAAPELLQKRTFDLEVLRSGTRMTLKVIIDEDS